MSNTSRSDKDPTSAPSRDVEYVFESVKVVRGREASTQADRQDAGWELVSESQGILRTEMTFRRVRPKTFGSHARAARAGFERLPRKTRVVVIALGALLLAAGIVGIIAGTQSGSENPEPSAIPTRPSTAPPAEPAVQDITVDELLDKLNAANMGGIGVGDRFRVTAELFEYDAWGIGSSGDFVVMMKAKDGADDLPVFVEEGDAEGWSDGTKVEMVVEMVEATINGETTDGWLEAQSVKTISGGTTKGAKEAAARQKLFGSLSDYAKAINKGAKTSVIDSIQPGSTERIIEVRLNLGFASLSTLEAQATIRTMNGHLVDIATENGLDRPMMKFKLADEVVAENRAVLDPSDVKFRGMLDD